MNSLKSHSRYGILLSILIAIPISTASSHLRTQNTLLPTSLSITVIDGDTLEIDGDVIQLFGIDAPELGQSCSNNGQTWHCGLNASFALKKIIETERSPASCRITKEERGMPAGICTIGYVDLAQELLLDGYAVTMDAFLPVYQEAERKAKQAHLGIWRGEFVNPSEWRQGKRSPGEAARAGGTCFVKGAVDSEGRRTYYVPTDREYDQIDIDRDKGGRCFPSDDLARDAGWRRQGELRSHLN